ncbi:MAG: hypothetical protein ABSF13_11375 [Smithella sp.]|jgi:hypothetical protein
MGSLRLLPEEAPLNYMKKLIGFRIIIIIIFSLTAVASANAAGFIFNWQPFVANTDLFLKSPSKKVLIKDSAVTDISIPISEDFRDIFSLSPDQNNYSTPKTEKKIAPGNIKITLSPASKFMTGRDEMYTNSNDEQVSRIINAITSLIYGDSKIKSLETIGKIIEPQINFYFEF